jgi:hypothetical protein
MATDGIWEEKMALRNLYFETIFTEFFRESVKILETKKNWPDQAKTTLCGGDFLSGSGKGLGEKVSQESLLQLKL